jgi:hypothetical protein
MLTTPFLILFSNYFIIIIISSSSSSSSSSSWSSTYYVGGVVVVVVVVWWRPHLHTHQWIVPEYIRTLDSTDLSYVLHTYSIQECWMLDSNYESRHCVIISVRVFLRHLLVILVGWKIEFLTPKNL